MKSRFRNKAWFYFIISLNKSKIVLTAAAPLWYNSLTVEKYGIAAVVSDTTRKGVLPMEYVIAFALVVMIIIAYIEKK